MNQIRNPNVETQNKFEIRMQNLDTEFHISELFRTSNFEFVSSFEFRILNFFSHVLCQN
jgi:hypothetical protein